MHDLQTPPERQRFEVLSSTYPHHMLLSVLKIDLIGLEEIVIRRPGDLELLRPPPREPLPTHPAHVPILLEQLRLPLLHLRPLIDHPPNIARLRRRRHIAIPKRRLSLRGDALRLLLPRGREVMLHGRAQIRPVVLHGDVVLLRAVRLEERVEVRDPLERVVDDDGGVAVDQVAQPAGPAVALGVGEELPLAVVFHGDDAVRIAPADLAEVRPGLVFAGGEELGAWFGDLLADVELAAPQELAGFGAEWGYGLFGLLAEGSVAANGVPAG
jgi:hypothetical protein